MTGYGGPVDPRTDVLLFPYDFRQSVRDAALRLDEAVGAALRQRGWTGSPARPVILLAHSMGNLVAWFWLTACEGWRHGPAASGPDPGDPGLAIDI